MRAHTIAHTTFRIQRRKTFHTRHFRVSILLAIIVCVFNSASRILLIMILNQSDWNKSNNNINSLLRENKANIVSIHIPVYRDMRISCCSPLWISGSPSFKPYIYTIYSVYLIDFVCCVLCVHVWIPFLMYEIQNMHTTTSSTTHRSVHKMKTL